MNVELKQQLETLYSAYSAKAGSDQTSALKEEMKSFLAYIAAANGVVAAGEVELLNQFLDLKIHTRELANYITANNIQSKEYETTVPRVFGAFIDHKDLSLLYISTMQKIGMEMIIADEAADAIEVDNLSSRIDFLCDYYNRRHPGDPLVLIRETTPPTQKKEIEKPKNPDDDKTLDELLTELDELIGLQSVKKNVYSLVHLQDIQMEREKRGIPKIAISNHLIFTGNPGTGKTTVARLLARIYYKIGLLSTGNFVEVDRSGMVAGYVGQTAIQVANVTDSAKGGVLFIDEAYALAGGLPGDYGNEAIETLLKRMEDNRDQIIVIVAGYPDLMEKFIASNPGLKSRFSKKIYFPDYNPEELLEIFKYTARKNHFILSDDAIAFATDVFKRKYAQRDENFANAREVRNFFEAGVVSQADRLYGKLNMTDEEIQTLTADDFRFNELIIDN